jgi:hypothetical protein
MKTPKHARTNVRREEERTRDRARAKEVNAATVFGSSEAPSSLLFQKKAPSIVENSRKKAKLNSGFSLDVDAELAMLVGSEDEGDVNEEQVQLELQRINHDLEFEKEWARFQVLCANFKHARILTLKKEIDHPHNKKYKDCVLPDGDILGFAEKWKSDFPYLAPVMKIIGSYGMGAAGVEVDFSIANRILTSTRSSLDPFMFEMLLLLNINFDRLPSMKEVITLQQKDYKASIPPRYRGDDEQALLHQLSSGDAEVPNAPTPRTLMNPNPPASDVFNTMENAVLFSSIRDETATNTITITELERLVENEQDNIDIESGAKPHLSNPEDSDIDDYVEGDVFDPEEDPFVNYVPAEGSGYESAIALLGLDNGLN